MPRIPIALDRQRGNLSSFNDLLLDQLTPPCIGRCNHVLLLPSHVFSELKAIVHFHKDQ